MTGVNYPGVTMASFRATGRLGLNSCFYLRCGLNDWCVPALILGAIITKIYPVRPTSAASRQAYLAQLESRLDQWYLGLPEALRYDTASRRMVPSPPVLQLHIRYWGSVLLLHRAL
jgi:hypothetical protein